MHDIFLFLFIGIYNIYAINMVILKTNYFLCNK